VTFYQNKFNMTLSQNNYTRPEKTFDICSRNGIIGKNNTAKAKKGKSSCSEIFREPASGASPVRDLQ